jgi:4'-phosphopantetheinyl transferase
VSIEKRALDQGVTVVLVEVCSASIRSAMRTLSPHERHHAARFLRKEDADRFIAARGCLRRLLAAQLSVSPGDLTFRKGEYGKPELDGVEGLSFNVSHSGNLALVAISAGGPLGVDIERIDSSSDFTSVATTSFSELEISEISATPADHRARAFFSCWTRKEAYIKATGRGLSTPLSSFAVWVGAADAVPLRWSASGERERLACHIMPLPVPQSYAAALAFRPARPASALANSTFDCNPSWGQA